MSKAESYNALVLCGDGINCEQETALALQMLGLNVEKLYSQDLLDSPTKLKNAAMLVLPGGFSFGDEIASGKVLAIKLREKLLEVLHEFIDANKVIIGICNGFQILVQLGILPDSGRKARPCVSLCHNRDGLFINKWVDLEVEGESRFFAGLSHLNLPIRHGEGRLALGAQCPDGTDKLVKSRAPLRYSSDINGSFDRIAALTNAADNVLGLMPHPEAFVRWSQHPAHLQLKYKRPACGLRIDSCDLESQPHGLTILKNALGILQT